jgi:SNF2 family DNA or RNA helicase
MRRSDEQHSLHLTWRDGQAHLWTLDPVDGSVGTLHDVIRVAERQLGRFVTLVSSPGRIDLALPHLPRGPVQAPSLRVQLAALDELDVRDAAPSLVWFHAACQLAGHVLRAERLRPRIESLGPAHIARWTPVIDDPLAASLATLHAAMPPVCAVDDITAFFVALVDAMARRRLSEQGWRPKPPLNARGADYRAAQTAFRALATDTGSVLYRSADLPALTALQRTLGHELDRAGDLPVVCPQVRLHLPDDVDGAWRLTLEVVDIDHPARWCSAADVRDSTPLALDLAGKADHIQRLGVHLADAGAQLAATVAVLAPLRRDPAAIIELDLDEVEAFLIDAPDLIDALEIRLLGPEQLVRSKAGVRATASPREAGAGGRFAASALVQWDATVDDTPVDDAQLQRAAESGSSLIHVNGRWVRLDAGQVKATLNRLQHSRDTIDELDVSALIKLAAESAAQAARPASAAGGTPLTVGGTGWITDLLDGLPDERLTEQVEPPGFTGELRHYQRRGLSWMGFLGRLGLGGCLADDMGLGKTATTLAHLVDLPGPHLVVCPLSVVHNWYAEAARFTPKLQVSIHHGTERARGDSAAEQLVPADIVVTTYGLLARDIDTLADVRWTTVVLDEAQSIKNHLTRAAKAVRQLSAGQKIALTGTPVENHLGELWSILDAVNPGLYGSSAQFGDRYAKPIQRDGDVAATEALRALTQPFILRRTKADKTLLPELPDKIEQIAWATLTKEQAAMYQAVVDQLLANAHAEVGMKRRGLVLAALTRLKQICNHPAHAAGDGSRIAGRSGKLARFDELVDSLLETGERALVFTQFREMGLILQRHLRDRLQMDAPFLHGGVARTGRDAMVRRFQDGSSAPLLLVSLKAGGTGLNLTSASQVIHYDRWWNPAVEDQATDRAWRLGQHHTVLVHKLVCEGTLEERISELIDDKRRLADSVLGTGEQWLTELSTDDLRALVALAPGGPR